MSPSSRRAWIEIDHACSARKHQRVALLAEGVDRNHKDMKKRKMNLVALLAEGVDRNFSGRICVLPFSRSPSSRRAWIEIII